MARKVVSSDPELGPLTFDRLTPTMRVYQRAEGHRFSSDDMVTAFVAHGACHDPARVLDLGCGLGSVLLTLAWKMPRARLVGVEAQEASFELLRRNVEANHLGERVTMWSGDLRDRQVMERAGHGFDLVTGTPPYFPDQTSVDARDDQRARARIEYRGGVESYLQAAAQAVSETGTIVICGDARAHGRVLTAATENQLFLHDACDVIAKEGKPPLFSVWTLRRFEAPSTARQLMLRDAQGEKTADALRLKAFSGFDVSNSK